MLKPLASLMACLLLMVSPALAATPDSPSQIVGRLYAPYLANPHAEPSDTAGAMDLIRPFASKSFGAAIDKDQACMARGGICNLDFDVLINGQDWDLSDFALESGANLVRAHFLNGRQTVVTFHFVKEDGVWKIDDMDNAVPGMDDKYSETISIKAVLNR